MDRSFAVMTAIFLAVPAFAQDVDPDRRAQFLTILAGHDCQFHNQTPPQALLDDMFAAGYDKAEIKAIGRNLLDTGDATIVANTLVASTGACAP